MRWMKWAGLLLVIVLIASCFMTWVVIQSKNITLTGVDTTGTSFGKPAYAHILLGTIFLVFHFIPAIWAKRANLIIAPINLAWALRNYFLITACRGGDCPEKHTGIYLVLAASILLLIAALFPDMKLQQEPADKP